jgi:hypothetical protein
MLKRLQQQIAQRYEIEPVEQAIAAADPARLDPWLRARLEDFSRKHSEMRPSRASRSQGGDRRSWNWDLSFYKKALDALRPRLSILASLDYQRATTTTALIDAEFDFNVDDGRSRRRPARLSCGRV